MPPVVCGTGGWVGPLPGDPDNNSILTATPAFGGIEVSWTFPSINSHAVAHTIVYRGLSADFNTAARRAVVDGNYFFDRVSAENSIQYFYWIEIVSVNGTVGELIGPASAIARPTIEEMIELLTGKIDSGVLAQSLKTEVDNITTVGANLLQEIQDRIAADNILGASVQSAETLANQALTYVADETVQRTQAHDILVQQVGVIAGLVNDNQGAILNEQTLRINQDGVLAQSISNTYAQVGADIAAAVQAETTARTSAGYAFASDVATVQSTLGDSIASVQTTLQTNINTVEDNLGALYHVKVQANGLAGGFGLYNDGTEVEAGFDVDRFWLGRTGVTLRKPFIVQGNEVFIDNAVINQLTADKIDTRNLTIKDANGVIIFSATQALGHAYIAKGNVFDLAVSGQIKSDNYVAGSAGFSITKAGSAEFRNVTVRGDVEASSLKANTAMINTAHLNSLSVTTAKINNNAVTIPVTYTTAASFTGWSTGYVEIGNIYVNPEGGTVILMCSANWQLTNAAWVWIRIRHSSGAIVAETRSVGVLTGYSGGGDSNPIYEGTAMALGTRAEAGTYYMDIRAATTPSGSLVTNRTLVGIGAKK